MMEARRKLRIQRWAAFYIRCAELQKRGHSNCRSIDIDPQPGFRWYSSDSAKWAICERLDSWSFHGNNDNCVHVVQTRKRNNILEFRNDKPSSIDASIKRAFIYQGRSAFRPNCRNNGLLINGIITGVFLLDVGLFPSETCCKYANKDRAYLPPNIYQCKLLAHKHGDWRFYLTWVLCIAKYRCLQLLTCHQEHPLQHL